MNTPPAAGAPPLTGNVLFYKDPQPLNPEQHAGLGIKQIQQPFGFMREAHAIPITVTEFGMVASCYPVIFIGDENTAGTLADIAEGDILSVIFDDGGTIESVIVLELA